MTYSFPKMVGRTPWSAADAPVGLLLMEEADSGGEKRVQGDPRGPGCPPHHLPEGAA